MEYDVQKSGASYQQRLRRISKPLTRLLQIANAVPRSSSVDLGNPDLPSDREIASGGGFQQAYAASWSARVRDLVAHWAPPAKKYVLNGPQFPESDNRYAEVIAVRDLLSRLADVNQGRTRSGRIDIAVDVPESVEMVSTIKLTLKGPPVSAALQANGLVGTLLACADLDRVKRCAHEKCRKLFFAARMNRPCCSERCRNKYKQKRHREREKENRVARKVLGKGAKTK